MNSATKLFNELHDSNLAIVFDITENLNPGIFFNLEVVALIAIRMGQFLVGDSDLRSIIHQN